MTKKRFVAILLCVTLVALAAIGATFAYLTDTKTVNNTFTMGNVKIKLDETNVNDPTGDRVTSNEYNVYPGAVVTKDPIVHNVGKNAAYIRATVNVSNWMNLCAAYFPILALLIPMRAMRSPWSFSSVSSAMAGALSASRLATPSPSVSSMRSSS